MASVGRRITRLLAAILGLGIVLSGCAASSAPSSVGASPSTAFSSPSALSSAIPSFSTEGGDPRTGGYWEMWSTCGPNSQAATAAANGGREAGWIIADDLIQDPGIEVGRLHVADCAQGLALLKIQAPDGSDRASDPVYQLAGQLYATELNLAAGARGCDRLEGAVIAAQTILTELGFDGTGAYLTSVGSPEYVARVAEITQQLAIYNGGGLC